MRAAALAYALAFPRQGLVSHSHAQRSKGSLHLDYPGPAQRPLPRAWVQRVEALAVGAVAPWWHCGVRSVPLVPRMYEATRASALP